MSCHIHSVFITGTDTDVGKTVLTSALLAAACARGLSAVPMKPIQTGAFKYNGRWRSPDADFCIRMAGLQLDAETYRDVAPCCYESACSPHLAARIARRRISIEALQSSFHRLEESYASVFIEGAGGVLSPINESQRMLDLIVAFKRPVIVAARPGLGTLNHTLLTLSALRTFGLCVTGVVLVETASVIWGELEHDNRQSIESMGQIPVLGVIPYLDNLDTAPEAPEAFVDAGAAILDQLLNLT